jgi:hypothetical protein
VRILTLDIDPAARLQRGHDLIARDFQSFTGDPALRALAEGKSAAEFTIDLTSGLYLTSHPMRLASLAAYAITDTVLSDVHSNRKDS